MLLDEAIKKRRSIRKWKEKIPSIQLIKKCMKAAGYAPSARNMQPWSFFVVKNKKIIEKLSKTQPYTSFLLNAPLCIVVCSENVDHWIEDCSLATMLFMLKATSLGLATCWGAVYSPKSEEREDYVRKILGTKKRILCLLGVGYAAEKPAKKKIKKFEIKIIK